MRTLLALLFFVVLAAPLHAQSAIPSSYQMNYYNQGAQQPFQSELFQAASVQCNQVVPTPGNSGVMVAYWDDPLFAGRVCVYSLGSGGPIYSFPTGNYEAGLVAINSAGQSPESNHAPFVLVAIAPGARTNLRVIRQ